jgi:hypothetical protein
MFLGAVVALLVAVATACVAVVQMRRIRQLRRTGVASVGTVMRHDETSDDGSLYAPVIAFVDEDGAERQFTVATRTSWRIHRVGQRVPVTYPPGRPDAPRLSSLTHDALAVGLPLAFGALFGLVGLFGLWRG